MNEAKHSRLPWTHGTDEDGSVIYDDNLGYVADVGADDGNVQLENANRDFIVMACNAHYELLEALEVMWEAFVPYSSPSPEQEEAIGLARAAINKAKGVSP